MSLINNTDYINLPLFIKGKDKNVYDVGDKLLMIATDRISSSGVVFSELIPDKGRVLNGISAFWFSMTSSIVPNHMITTDISKYPKVLAPYAKQIEGQSMLVKKMEMINVECIVRGYLEGSGLREYMKKGTVAGINLRPGLRQCEKLPEPIFTPSIAAEGGHDENITFGQLADSIGFDLALRLKEASISLYLIACKHAESRGIILADTKFEFGIVNGKLTVGDEMCTPDSSRFWDLAEYEPGRPQQSFDKQYLREYLESSGWNKRLPAPKLPECIVTRTRMKYIEAYERITGKKLG